MSIVDQHFEEALRSLPEKKLSWRTSRRIRKMLVYRAAELDGKTPIWGFLQRLVAVPMALSICAFSFVNAPTRAPSLDA